jgi:hypothetical protein
MLKLFIKNTTCFFILTLVSAIAVLATLCATAHAMEMVVTGNTIILSGAVKGDEPSLVKAAFAANPQIDLVVLRNSYGGDANAGYRVGEYLREIGVTTAVSGYCISSCSRMFLGGKTRLFTDDYPPDRTFVGFHGHYSVTGNLDRASTEKRGLYDWIIRFSDGKADPELVKRWVTIQKNNGAANFFHPDVATHLGHSVFFCDGWQRKKPTECETIPTDAIARGVATDTRRISSPDKATLPQ